MGFNDASINYFYSSDHIKGDDLEFVREYFKNREFEKLLDVASAAGHFAKVFNAEEKIITDISLNMLKTAKDKNGFDKLVAVSACRLPFKNGVFDIAGCRIALHHFKKPREFFFEVNRVLKRSGYFVLIDSIVDKDDKYLNKIERIRDNTHIKSYTIKEIVNFSYMFRLLTFHTIFKKHDFVEWANRLNPTQEEFREVEKAFLDLSEDEKRQLRVEIKKGRVVSYTDKKGIFIFKKIEKEGGLK